MFSNTSARTPTQRLIAGLLIALQALPPTLYAGGAWAQSTSHPISPDKSVAGQRPVVNVGANGVPIVQIAPPSSAGVSHNRFTDYNVGPGGVILNNSGASSQTQLGGWIGGNPMLGNSSAKTILNEVTGNVSSRLDGYTEVAGNRTNVIVANPNGISCNGCGFINAPRSTLTTGMPQTGGDGGINGFDVQRGQISIDGQGLNGANVDQIDLISRSLRVNADIWAGTLNITTGANKVDYDSGQATQQSGSGSAPVVAVDVAQLGGMYANSIRMIGTEAGVGVNSAGTIAALTGELTVDSAGDVRITDGRVQAKGDLHLRGAKDVNNAGTLYAEEDASFQVSGALRNTGLMAAARHLQADATALANAGTIAGGVNEQGQAALTGNVAIQVSRELQSSGQLIAGHSASLSGETVTLDNGTLSASQEITVIAADTLANRGGELIADRALLHAGNGLDNSGGTIQANTVSVSAPRLDNTSGTIVQTGNDDHLQIHAQKGIVNDQGRIAANAVKVTLSGSEISNVGGAIEHAGNGQLVVQAVDGIDNTQGSIASNGATLNLSAQSLNNTQGRIEHAGAGDLFLDGGDTVVNTAGVIASNGNATLKGGTIINTTEMVQGIAMQGQITALGQLQVEAAATVNNDGGLVQGNGGLTISAPNLTNAAGSLLSGGQLALAVAQTDNRNGTIAANRLSLSATNLKNLGGEILSLDSTDAASVTVVENLDNAGGKITGNGSLVVIGASVGNQGGVIQSAGDDGLIVNTAGALDNSLSGLIASAGAMEVQAATLNNLSGEITSGATLNIGTAAAIDNTQGVVAATGKVTVTADGGFINHQGVVGSVQGALNIRSVGATDNTEGRLEAAQDLTLLANGINSSHGVIVGSNVDIDSEGQTFDNTDGKLAARGTLSIHSGQLVNTGGLLQADGALSIDTDGQALKNDLSGTDGGIIGKATLEIDTGTLGNEGGFIGGADAITINAAQINNTGNGSVVGQNKLTLNSSNFNNAGGGLQAQSDINLNLGTGKLDNSGSLLRSGGTLSVNAGSIINADTSGADQGLEGIDVQLSADTIDNSNGAIRADEQLAITAGSDLDNAQGLVSSGKTATVDVPAISNTLGTLIAGDSLTVTATDLSGDGKLLSLGDMSVSVVGAFDNAGQVQANDNLVLEAQGAVTNSGLIRAGKQLDLSAASLINKASGEISAGTTDIAVTGAIANSGLIDGTLTRIAADTVHNTGRIYGGHVAVQAGTLTNDTTGVIAARDSMALGVGHLVNREHALIYSAGKLDIGGALDNQNQANGTASSITNASATIESAGNMVLATDTLTNRNDHFSMGTQVVGAEQIVEYQPVGSGTRYAAASVGFNNLDSGRLVLNSAIYPLAKFGTNPYQGSLQFICTDGECVDGYYVPSNTYSKASSVWNVFGISTPGPEPISPGNCNPFKPGGWSQACKDYSVAHGNWTSGWDYAYVQLDEAIEVFNKNLYGRMVEDWYTYSYTRTTSESTVQSSDPARILAGGNLTLSGAVTNDKSQMIAGGALNGVAASINNIDAQGARTVTDSGTIQLTELVSCGWDDHCRNWYGAGAYQPAPQITNIGLPVAVVQQNTNVASSTTVPVVAAGALVQSVTGASQVDSTIATDMEISGVAAVNAVPAATGPNINGALVQVSVPSTTTPLVVLTSIPSGNIPNNSLFITHPEPDHSYLVETDPRFADYRSWLSSDFMLQQMSRDPARTLKRLGDGFYEQKLVAEQIMLATGQRFIGGHTSNEDQYRDLMLAGAEFAGKYQLNVGTALSEEQMKLLTADIVWLVQREVTLADGSVQTVLVPQVYVRVKEGDLRGDGTLMAADEVRLDIAGDINSSAAIAGRSVNALVADNINNLGGRILGDTVTVVARNDINNLSGTIAGNNIALQAGRDINIATRTIDSVGATGTRTGADRVAVVRGGKIAAAAGRDLVIAGAQINASGDIVLLADRKATIETVRTNSTLDLATRGHIREQEAGHVGSLIDAGGDLTVASGLAQDGDLTVRGSALRSAGELSAVGTNVNIESAVAGRTVDIFTQLKNGTRSIDEHTEAAAGGSLSASGDLTVLARGSRDSNGVAQAGTGDLTLKGAQLGSDSGDITLAAGNDVHLVQQQLAYSLRDESTYKGGTAFSSKSSNTLTDVASTQSIGSTISGDSIRVGADHDITAKAATVVATRDVTLSAGNDITITTAEDTSRQHHVHQEKTSGLFSNGGASITLGSQQLDRNSDSQSLTHTGSQVASLEGDIRIDAGNKYQQTGSDVLALGGDIDIAAQQVDINASIGTHASRQQEKTRQGGLSLSFSNAVISAAQTVTQMAESSGNTEDSRMQALAAATAAMSVSNAAAQVAKDPQNLGGSKITLSLGSSKSESNSEQQATVATGSKVAAGGDVTIAATGAGQDSNLTVIGSDIIAGHDATLTADNQIKLLAAENTLTERSDNQSSSASIGIGFASGGSQNGFTLEVAASSARGNADGSDLTHTNSHISAGNTAALASGGDTTLQGAVVSGKTVTADVGGNLHIESLQDSSQFDSKQSNSGFSASICVPPFCYGSSSASVNAGKAKVDGDYLSVVEQSGIQAGDGGFDVKVQGNTDLTGAVIASSQSAIDNNKNRLETGSLTTRDLANHDSYEAGGYSVSGSVGTQMGDQSEAANPDMTQADKAAANAAGNPANHKPGASAGIGSANGSQSSTSRSGISAGSIVITDEAAQQALTGQDAATTVASLNTEVTTGSDAGALAKAWNGQKLQQEVQGQIAITQAFSQVAPKAVAEFADSQKNRLMGEAIAAAQAGDTEKANALKNEADKWGEGRAYRIALHTAVGGLGGGINGAAGAAASASAANLMNDLQNGTQQALEDAGLGKDTANLMARGIAALTASGIGAAVGGTQGAATAYTVDVNNRQLHPKEKMRIKELAGNEPEKEARLTAAACAMVHCYAEYPVGSTAYQELLQLAAVGAGDAFAGERQQLSNQSNMFGYSTTGVFNDANLDALKQLNNTYELGTRALGGGQMVLGGVGVTGSVVTAPVSCATGVGCVANAAVGVISFDAAYAGAKQLVSGNPEATYLNQGLQSLGMSPEAAAWTEVALGIGSAMKAGAVANKAIDDAIATSKLSVASYQNFAPNGVKVTSEVMQTPQAQALVKEIQAANPHLSQSAVERFAKEYIASGSSLPQTGIAAPGTTLVKVVPKGDSVSPYTGYWMSPQQAQAIATMTPEQAGQVLGLPAAQAAKMLQNGVEFYAIAPKPGVTPNVFVSNVASTTQGAVTMPGGAQQVIVPNRTLWTEPIPVNPFTLTSKGGN